MTSTGTARRTRRTGAIAAGAIALLAISLGAAWALGASRGNDMTAATAQPVSSEQLKAAAEQRVFFGHQSVGMNVLDGIPAVYAAQGMTAPTVQQTSDPTGTGGFMAHQYVGENTKPLTKVEDFASQMRSGLADKVDVAFMKLCYVDITGATDVDALFAEYRRTLASLEADYPEVTFLHVTTPLTTESSGLKALAKRTLGRPDANAADNVARQRYNELMRQEYGDTGRLFDLAAVESTRADGTRVSGEYEGAPFYALDPALSSDGGHLNAAGASLAAADLIELVASAAGA